jgi:hypothetical protein
LLTSVIVLKKDRETEVREGLAAGRRKRKRDANNSDSEVGGPSATRLDTVVTVRVVIVEPDRSDDEVEFGKLRWATASRKQLVALEKRTLKEIHEAIAERIPEGKHIRAIFGACEKPPADGKEPSDVERICSNQDLENFLRVAQGVYKPIVLQIVLVRSGGVDEQSPPPDDRGYFAYDHFDLDDSPYDPIPSDSENEVYLINFGKKKPKSWPRSDEGYEKTKAKTRKRICRLQSHLKEIKSRHRKFMAEKSRNVIDSDDDAFSLIRYLNPQSGKQYLKARRAARAGRVAWEAENERVVANEGTAEADIRARIAATRAAKAIYGEPSTGDFNTFPDDDSDDDPGTSTGRHPTTTVAGPSNTSTGRRPTTAVAGPSNTNTGRRPTTTVTDTSTTTAPTTMPASSTTTGTSSRLPITVPASSSSTRTPTTAPTTAKASSSTTTAASKARKSTRTRTPTRTRTRTRTRTPTRTPTKASKSTRTPTTAAAKASSRHTTAVHTVDSSSEHSASGGEDSRGGGRGGGGEDEESGGDSGEVEGEGEGGDEGEDEPVAKSDRGEDETAIPAVPRPRSTTKKGKKPSSSKPRPSRTGKQRA